MGSPSGGSHGMFGSPMGSPPPPGVTQPPSSVGSVVGQSVVGPPVVSLQQGSSHSQPQTSPLPLVTPSPLPLVTSPRPLPPPPHSH